MPTLALRAILAALAAALLLSISGIVLAEPTPAPAIAEDQRILPYVEPDQLVNIGGRRINLHCTGAGGPTVILMAGLFSWSVVWYKTQPVIAQKTRVCAFDRAGYGFSDPGPRPGLPALQAGTSGAVVVQYACVRPGHARNCAKIFIDGAYLAVGHVLVHGPRHDLQ